jgi:Skp family chaperone for outer membrane proteins
MANEKEQFDLIVKEVKNEIASDLQKANEAIANLNLKSETFEKDFEKINADLQAKLDKHAENVGTLTKAEIKELKAEIEELNNALKIQGEKISDGLLGAEAEKGKGLTDVIYTALKKQGLLGEPVLQKDGSYKTPIGNTARNIGDRYQIDVPIGTKAPVDMTEANVLAPDGDRISIYYDPELVPIPLTNNLHTEQFMRSQMIGEKYFGILVEYDEEDGAETRPEASAPTKSSFKFKTEEFKVFSIATDFRISQESLDDVSEFLTEIQRLAPDRIASKLDEKILSGTGDGVTDIKPLISADHSVQIDFSTSPYAGTVTSPNIIDVVAKAKLTLLLLDENPNFVVMHHNQIDETEGLKDADNNSIQDNRMKIMDGNLEMLSKLKVIGNRKIGNNKLVIGDVREAVIGKRKNVTISLGYNGDDWTERMVTVRVDMRAAFAVRKKNAFAYVADIDQAITDLTVVTP